LNERRQGHSYPLPFFCLLHGWKWELAQEKKRLLEEKGREKRKETKLGNLNASKTKLSTVDNDEFTDSTSKQEPKHDTRKELAKELNWSTGKVAMARRSAVFSKGSF